MNEFMRLYSMSHHSNDGKWIPKNGHKYLTEESMANAVAQILQTRWIDDPPTPECFDVDDAKMSRLLSFINHEDEAKDFGDVREHLIDCPRCRYLYSQLCEEESKAVTAGFSAIADRRPLIDPPPTMLSDSLRTTGPVVFPDGTFGEGAWEFGLLGKLPSPVAEPICELIATRACQKLRRDLPREGIVVVCFSQPMHLCGKRFASKLVEDGAEDVHVVMADGYFDPKLWCDPRELEGQYVIVLVDVVHSGTLLERLLRVCRQGEPQTLLGLAVINQATEYAPSAPLHALWFEMPEKRAPLKMSRQADMRFFDPDAGIARPREGMPKEVADTSRARKTVEQHLTVIEPIFKYIEATGALKQDAQIGGVCYPWAVDLLCLLRHDEARAELALRASKALSDLAARGPWCLVFPAERHQRAGAWAELLANAFRWPIAKVGLKARAHYRPLTHRQLRQLSRCPRALIVDAAIRTGKTLQSLTTVLRQHALPAVKEVAAFYAFDGLFSEPRASLETALNVEIRSLFQLPMGAPTEPVGRHCRHRLQDTLDELNLDAHDVDAGWIQVVRAYCRKRLERLGAPAPRPRMDPLRQSLQRAIDEGERGPRARLEHACDPPRSSLVKHLDVTYALREPRTRNVLHGFLCNSMPPEFIESCALALATQEDYKWFDRDWLTLHKRLFTNAASPRWQFLVCIGYWMRRNSHVGELDRVRRAVDDFSRYHADDEAPMLFPEMGEAPASPESLRSRCDTLLSVLSPNS